MLIRQIAISKQMLAISDKTFTLQSAIIEKGIQIGFYKKS